MASGEGMPAPGYFGEWTFRIKVKACEDACGVYAQGGTSVWTEFVRLEGSIGTFGFYNEDKKKKSRSSTKVIRWYIGDMTTGQEETLLVTVKGTIPADAPCFLHDPDTDEPTVPNTLNVSGNWSATFSTDDCVNFEKTEYTPKVLVTVTCPSDE